MNTKGFTLVELLAVIVILAIILLIAVPNVMGIIEKAKKDAFCSTAKLAYNSVELFNLQHNTAIAGQDVTIDLATGSGQSADGSFAEDFEQLEGLERFTSGKFILGYNGSSISITVDPSDPLVAAEGGYTIYSVNKQECMFN